MGLYNLKNIEFYGNYKTYKTINEIIKEQKVFELCFEENDYYLTSDAFNKIADNDNNITKRARSPICLVI